MTSQNRFIFGKKVCEMLTEC